jgi:hypothetical protein
MNWPLLLNLVANSVILAIVTTVVPSTAAGIVSGTAGLALNQAFEAAFIARTIIQPISSMMQRRQEGPRINLKHESAQRQAPLRLAIRMLEPKF